DGSPALCDTIKRTHRTPVTREDAPAIHWVDGDDKPIGKENDCSRTRRKDFTVALFVRGDDASTEIDELIESINERLNPDTPYGDGITLHQGAIQPETEIADTDATQVNMAYWFEYEAKPGWSLS